VVSFVLEGKFWVKPIEQLQIFIDRSAEYRRHFVTFFTMKYRGLSVPILAFGCWAQERVDMVLQHFCVMI
jgi:hypothetical protein